MIQSLVFAVVIFCSLLGALGQVLFKVGSNRITGINLSIVNLPLFFGLLFYALATILFVLALRKEQLSLLYPLIALSYVWVALLSYFVLKEPVSITNFVGVGIIIVGVSLAVYR